MTYDRTMAFMPRLTDYLNSTGLIYTVRKYKMKDALVSINSVGSCTRKYTGDITIKEDLNYFYTRSGFNTVEDWWNTIEEINHWLPTKEKPMYLYKVEKIRI